MAHPHDYISPRAATHVFGDWTWRVNQKEDGTRSVHFEGELPLSSANHLFSEELFRNPNCRLVTG